jgi:hypothetical protein
MARLMAFYPQQFTLHLNGMNYSVKAELYSTFLPLLEDNTAYDLDKHIYMLLHKVSNLKEPSVYLSAIP